MEKTKLKDAIERLAQNAYNAGKFGPKDPNNEYGFTDFTSWCNVHLDSHIKEIEKLNE